MREYRLYRQHTSGSREFVCTIKAPDIDTFFSQANSAYRGNLKPGWSLKFKRIV